MKRLLALIIPALIAAMLCGAADKVASIFARGNLVAWCIVPFDSKKRGPEERSAMLKMLGLSKFVYDWRDKDIPDFDREIDALQKHGIHLQGFWTPHPASPAQSGKLPVILDLLRRRKLRTELWLSISQDKAFVAMSDEQKLETASAILKKVALEALALDCKVGLYNHGGWHGEPENQIRVIERVGMKNVGIVYNFHHGHEHIARFPELLAKMRPHLLAININGMSADAKILPVGDGRHELEMLRAIQRSGYRGPIGILGHREEMDAEESLRLNMMGLKRLLPALGEDAAARTY